MSYVKMNNYRSIDGLMKDLFNDFPSAVNKTIREDVLHYPPVNITEKTQSFLVELFVPGYEKADFAIKLDENILTVSTEKREAPLAENDKTLRKEFGLKTFKRSFTLNEKTDMENISARYDNGILKLEIPKKEIHKAGAKDINVL